MTEKTATPKSVQAKKVSPARKAVATKLTATAAVKKMPGKAVVTVEKKVKKDNKIKMIRDSFTMPKNEHAKLAELKQLCQQGGLKVKKSELLRAGLNALGKLSAAQLKVALSGLTKKN